MAAQCEKCHGSSRLNIFGVHPDHYWKCERCMEQELIDYLNEERKEN